MTLPIDYVGLVLAHFRTATGPQRSYGNIYSALLILYATRIGTNRSHNDRFVLALVT